MLELALNGIDLKLRYKNGPFNFQELGILTATDASFAGESGSRSQQGRIHFLVPAPQLLDPECCACDGSVVFLVPPSSGMQSNHASRDLCSAKRPGSWRWSSSPIGRTVRVRHDRPRLARCQQKSNPACDALRLPEPCKNFNTEAPARVQDKGLN